MKKRNRIRNPADENQMKTNATDNPTMLSKYRANAKTDQIPIKFKLKCSISE